MRAKLGKRVISGLKPRKNRYEVWDTDIPGFLLVVYPSGGMTYVLRYRDANGKRNRLKIGDTRVLSPLQARDRAKELLADVTKGEDPAEQKRAGRGHTLETYLDEVYGPWLLAHRKSGRETLRCLKSSFEELQNKKLADVTRWNVAKWQSKRLKDGAKPGTVNRGVAYLRAALARAHEWGMIPENPLSRMKLVRDDTSPRIRYLEPEEDQSLMEALDRREERIRTERDNHNAWCCERGYAEWPDLRGTAFADHLKPMIILSLNTGVRRGELYALRWADVDLGRAMMTVRGETAKSGRQRHVPLNAVALSTLQGWHAQAGGSGLVFKNPKGQPFTHCNTAWRQVLRDAGITGFRWHDMRHDFASKLVMAGVDLNTVRELLGHSDIKMTLRYAHLAPRVKAEAVERLVSQASNITEFGKTATDAQ